VLLLLLLLRAEPPPALPPLLPLPVAPWAPGRVRALPSRRRVDLRRTGGPV
jgi:hypothetical protein